MLYSPCPHFPRLVMLGPLVVFALTMVMYATSKSKNRAFANRVFGYFLALTS